MKILWLFLLFPTVFAQPGFGTSYLKNSRLCHEWSCLNRKLGLPDSLPPRDHFTAVLKSLLPPGTWQDVVGKVLDVCYGDRPRRYTNTCPGQALMHCVVDQLVNNCPEENLRKDDACSPVASLAGVKYLFSQSLYENLDRNLPTERRPTWFVKNYFDTRCCNLPPLFDSAVLSQCGFFELIHYYSHTSQYNNVTPMREIPPAPVTPANKGDALQIVDFNDIQPTISSGYLVFQTPLECCDISEFIKPQWVSSCDFHLSWDGPRRLEFNVSLSAPTEQPAVTTTPRTRPRDHILLPQSCEKETCVFKHLNIIDEMGAVDTAAFLKLLDNFTDANPSWNKAKARVVTTCLTKPLTDYEADCEINKILACSFDVLTENCPYAKKNDICKHTKQDVICEISSSKNRPKNRRSMCYLPSLVHPHYLQQCGINSISRIQHSADYSRTTRHSWTSSKNGCQDLTPATTCLLSKMGVLNKYGFMGYFVMKEKIREFTTNHPEWRALTDAIISSSVSTPMYGQHCNSPKKLLNILDTMLMTCPASRRKNTPQCTRLFSDISNTPPERNLTQEKLQQILKHFEHVFLPQPSITTQSGRILPNRRTKKIVKTPLYDFGLLNSKNAPPVKIIDIQSSKTKPASTIVPVYMRVPIYRKNLFFTPQRNPGVLRTAPLWYRGRIVTPPIPHMFNGKINPTTYTPSVSPVTTTSMNPTKFNTSVLSMKVPQPQKMYNITAPFDYSTIIPV